MAGQWLLEMFLSYCKNFQTRITLDVLENMKDVGQAKEAMRNIFTNLAIVAALILTIAFAMLFLGDHMEENSTPKTAHAFVALAGYATLQAIRAMIESVVNLVYTEPLTSPEIIRFIITGPGAIGAPVMAIFFSMVSIMLGTVLWIAQMYSFAAAAAFAFFALKGVASTIIFSRKRSLFSTSRDKKRSKAWSWAELDEEAGPAPHHVTKKCSRKEIVIMRARAKDAVVFEQAAAAAREESRSHFKIEVPAQAPWSASVAPEEEGDASKPGMPISQV
jgi:membrane protein implicated in regulation of membrane protease activity